MDVSSNIRQNGVLLTKVVVKHNYMVKTFYNSVLPVDLPVKILKALLPSSFLPIGLAVKILKVLPFWLHALPISIS